MNDTIPSLRAYHGRVAIKNKYLKRVRGHRAADEIIKGQYWEPESDGVFKGCAVGCTLHSGKHENYPTELGVPVELAYLEDHIFENLPEKEALDWPEQFLNAIPVGADLSGVWLEFHAWMLDGDKWGVVNATDKPDIQAVAKNVASWFRRKAAGEKISDDETAKLDRDVWAVRAVWDVRAVRAVRAVWAVWAVRDVWDVRAVRAVRAVWAVWAEFYVAISKKLLALLASAKTGNSPASSRSAPSRRAPVPRLRAGK